MSILDDAIREHLELKRAHGADEAEIKKLEDEAFGPPGRPEEPDPLAEAPTEFLTTPDAPAASEGDEGRRINIADLQEPPEPTPPQEEPRVEATETVEPEADPGPLAPAEDPAQAGPPAEEEPPAIEHEIVPEPEPEPEPEAQLEPAESEPAAKPAEPATAPPADAGAGHNTEERHAIAEQPTELFDIEAEMGTEDAPATEAPSEIQASRAEPPAAAEEEEEDDDFWSEQRLSDELDQALEAPPEADEARREAQPEQSRPPAQPEPAQPEQPEQPQPAAEQGHEEYEPKQPGHEDVLEDTPEFLEESPEDDELWFEQRPPKDFDFDD